MSLSEMDDDQLREALREHGSAAAFARAIGVPRSTVRNQLYRRGIAGASSPTRQSKVCLTRESLHRALLPPNNCKVKAFLDTLDDESRTVVEEALGYNNKDFPPAELLTWLVGEGFREQDLPGRDVVLDHRAGRRPCRCRG